ncbi:MAG: cache domain-containing protein [Rhodospirillales bacterium]
MKLSRWVAVFVVLLLAAAPARAADTGTAAEAKAVLEKVVAAIKADKATALAEINAGKFNVKDLYPFCGGPDGNFTAHGSNPSLVGQSMKDRKDPTGKAYGEEFYKIAQEGKFAEASYSINKPGETVAVPKESYITKIGDQVCGVGFYK